MTITGMTNEQHGTFYIKSGGAWFSFDVVLADGVGGFETTPHPSSDIQFRTAKQKAINEGMQVRTDESRDGTIALICPVEWDTEAVIQSFCMVLDTLNNMLGGANVNLN